MQFYKLESNGNNFIITINNQNSNIDVKKLCDYKYGIGADGYINIDSKFNVSIFNNDGSVAKMCGNGLRCLVKLLFILTNECSYTFYLNGKEIYGYIDQDLCAISIDSPILIKQNDGYLVNLMNNHYICFVNNLDDYVFSNKDIEFSKNNKCNIHAIKVINNKKIHMKTYEYGVGETTSCGSGALCSFFVCNMLNKVCNSIEVISNGGILYLETINNKYILKGKASLIYKGEYYEL